MVKHDPVQPAQGHQFLITALPITLEKNQAFELLFITMTFGLH